MSSSSEDAARNASVDQASASLKDHARLFLDGIIGPGCQPSEEQLGRMATGFSGSPADDRPLGPMDCARLCSAAQAAMWMVLVEAGVIEYVPLEEEFKWN